MKEYDKMCSPDKLMFLEDTTPVHSHWQGVINVLTGQTGDKTKSVSPFQQRAFFLYSNQQCSSVKPMYFKEIIG
jgi:hypothetical protein